MLDKKPLETDEWRPVARKRKNTKRWCKGKEGVEHEPVVELNKSLTHLNTIIMEREGVTFCQSHSDKQGWMDCLHHVICSNCGKELKMCPDVCPETGNTIQ